MRRLRAVVSLILLIILVFGVPPLLLRIGPDLVDHVPSLSDLPQLLTRPDDGSLLLLALLVAAWAGWVMFAASVIIEIVAQVRDLPTPNLPGLRPAQRAAAVLIGSIVLGLGAPSQPIAPPLSAAATPASGIGLPVEEFVATPAEGALEAAPVQPIAADLPETQKGGEVPSRAEPPTVRVERGDTLWSLAERHLGSGSRYSEIVALNTGAAQPDGRRLVDAGTIYPGWRLVLPSDARAAEEHRQGSDAPSEVEVTAGDTLWDIAQDRLGQGDRYPELFAANKSKPQPDGGALTDPNLIRPGWQILIPGGGTSVPTLHSPEDAPPLDEPPQPGDAGPEDSDDSASAAIPPEPTLHAMPLPSPEAAEPQVGPGTDHAAAQEEAAEGAALPALVLGLGALAATGFVGEVARRRGLQQRFRRRGQRIVLPNHPEERALRARSDELTVQAARDALRLLALRCQASGRPLPDVQTIRFGPTSMTLHLVDDGTDPLAPFEAIDSRTWSLEPNMVSEVPPSVCDPYPALVTVGVVDEAMLLVNLESVGRLTITGEDAEAAPVAAALAFEISVSPFAEAAVVSLVGLMPELVGESGQARTRGLTPDEADVQANTRRRQIEGVLRNRTAADLRAARLGMSAVDEAGCEVFVTASALVEAPAPWSGLAELTTDASWLDAEAPSNTEGLVLELLEDGRARLEPLGIDVHPQRLAAGTLVSLGETLAVASEVDEDPGENEASTPEVVAAALPTPPMRQGPEQVEDPGAPRVLLLGQVEVTGTNNSAVRGRRGRATELVAFLALHPGASMYEVDEALWPERRVPRNTRNGLTSAARAWLGRDDEGTPYLPLVGEGGEYQLDVRVTCDWHDFLSLAEHGLQAQGDGIEDLEKALDLVRGRPFLGVRPDTYTWAEKHIQEMISAIVDVADVAARHNARVCDHRKAASAALAGLRADSSSEDLAEMAVKSLESLGDPEAAERVRRSLQRLNDA